MYDIWARLVEGIPSMVRQQPAILIAGVAFAVYANIAAHLIQAPRWKRIMLVVWGLLFPFLFGALLMLGFLATGAIGGLFFGIIFATVVGTGSTGFVLAAVFPTKVVIDASIWAIAAPIITILGAYLYAVMVEPLPFDPTVILLIVAWHLGLCIPLLIRCRRG